MAGWFLFDVCIMVNDIESLKHPSFCNRFAQPFLHEALVSRSPLSNASLWEIVQARTSLSRCRLFHTSRVVSQTKVKRPFFPFDARHSEKWLSISEKNQIFLYQPLFTEEIAEIAFWFPWRDFSLSLSIENRFRFRSNAVSTMGVWFNPSWLRFFLSFKLLWSAEGSLMDWRPSLGDVKWH